MTFEEHWRKHHPLDWWASERKGEPLPNGDRLLVWAICQSVWHAAQAAMREKASSAARLEQNHGDDELDNPVWMAGWNAACEFLARSIRALTIE